MISDQYHEKTTSSVERNWQRGIGLPLLIILVTVLADQITKWLVTRSLGPAQPAHRHDLVGTFFAIEYVQNSGAAFGLFRGQTGILTVAAVLVVIILIVSYRRMPKPSLLLIIGLGLLLGGALGNLIDRLRFGFVVDFISVGIWPTFNIADSAITIGVLLLAVQFWRSETSRSHSAASTSQNIDTVNSHQ